MSSESIKKKANILLWLSIFLFIAGFALFGALAYMNSATQLDSSASTSSSSSQPGGDDYLTWIKMVVSYILSIAALATLMTGCIGCCVAKCRNKWVIMWYGCNLGCSSCAVIIIGVMLASASTNVPAMMAPMCATPQNAPGKWDFQKVTFMDTGMLNVTNKYMCSADCPCDPTLYTAGYTSLPASNFTFNGRSKAAGATNGAKPIVLATAGQKAYKNMFECLNGPVKAATDNNTFSAYQAYFAFMKPMEVNAMCSGWCTPALFWFNKNIDTVPSKPCLPYVSTTIGGGYSIPGYITICIGVLKLCIFFFQYSLWCDKPDEQFGTS